MSMMIFVFGSNRLGCHGGGAAREAMLSHGATWGLGEGMSGHSYALPTKQDPMKSLSLGEVSDHVKKFLDFAKSRLNDNFLVTRVGCGLAGFTDKQIAPLFHGAPRNCFFPPEWNGLLG